MQDRDDTDNVEAVSVKSSARRRADAVKAHRCKHLIAVLEDPHDVKNIGSVIRNVNALGVEKVYIVDPRRTLPDGSRLHRGPCRHPVPVRGRA